MHWYPLFLGKLGGEGLILTLIVREETYDNSQPWGFFDGPASEDQLKCGGGGCLYLSTSHLCLIKSVLGIGTNNYVELLALKLLLLFVVEKGCKTLQVFGDSLLIIKWEKRVQICHIAHLVPIFKEVMRIIIYLTLSILLISIGRRIGWWIDFLKNPHD